MIILLWILFSFFVAIVSGSARTIGFWASLLLCLLLSPLIGLIITLCFESKVTKHQRDHMIYLQQQQLRAIKEQKISGIDELEKLLKMKEMGQITDEEFQKMKSKIVN